MKLVSRHFSGAQNLEVARTSWGNIWNVDVNMSGRVQVFRVNDNRK